jgi:hypothetical protein
MQESDQQLLSYATFLKQKYNQIDNELQTQNKKRRALMASNNATKKELLQIAVAFRTVYKSDHDSMLDDYKYG